MDANNKCIRFDLIMLRLLNQLNYYPPNLKLYKKDSCEVTFDDYNQMYRLFIGGEDYMSYRIKELLIIISILIPNSLMMWKLFILMLMITKANVTLFY